MEMASEETQKPETPKTSILLIVALLNSLAVLAAAGFLVYTKFFFKRPPITEEGERTRLALQKAAPAKTTPGTVVFDSMTVNIATAPLQPKAADGTPRQLDGKLHYATVGFVLEVRDETQKGKVEGLRSVIMDQFLSMIGRKQFHELTTVQGRYVFRVQILEMVNQLLAKKYPSISDPLVINLFFTTFMVQ